MDYLTILCQTILTNTLNIICNQYPIIYNILLFYLVNILCLATEYSQETFHMRMNQNIITRLPLTHKTDPLHWLSTWELLF